jgi:hypothetical protein
MELALAPLMALSEAGGFARACPGEGAARVPMREDVGVRTLPPRALLSRDPMPSY